MNQLFKNIHYFFKNTKLIFQIDYKNLLIVSFFKILEIPIPILMIYTAKLIMDEVSLSMVSSGNELTKALTYVGYELLLITSSNIFHLIQSFYQKKLSANLEIYFSKVFFDKISKVKYNQLENPKVVNLIDDAKFANLKSMILFDSGLQLIKEFSQLFSLFGLLVFVNPYVAVGVLVLSTVSFIFDLFFINKREKFRKSNLRHFRQRIYFSSLIYESSPAKEIILTNSHSEIKKKYIDSIFNYHLNDLNVKHTENILKFFLKIISSVLYYGFYAWLIVNTILKLITLGNLTLYIATFSRVELSVSSIYRSIQDLYKSMIDSKNYFDFLDLPEDNQEGVSPDEFISIIKNPTIEFENVSFKYPGSESYVFENLSFKIEYGQKIALVGENGAGKTTIIKVLSRLYEPTSGVVKIGGVDSTKLSRTQCASIFSIIFQDFTNFKFIFKDAVKIANINSTEEEYIDSLKKSGADKIVETLPLQDSHPLSRLFEETGIELSGGQWQKVALARAFIRSGKLLILDEPTAAIDANQEFEIFSHFQELTKGKTSLLVSHRFSTVRMADKIIFLENGKIIEQGSHQDLMFLDGKYAQMFNRQAKGYL